MEEENRQENQNPDLDMQGKKHRHGLFQDTERFGKRWIPYTIATCSAVGLYLLLANLKGIWNGIQAVTRYVSPVLWAVIIAYIIDTFVMFFRRTLFKRAKHEKPARQLSILFAVLIILILLVLIIGALIPQLIESITMLLSNLGNYAASLSNLLKLQTIEFAGYQIDLSTIVEYGNSILGRIVSFLQENAGKILNVSFTVGKGFLNSLICCILAVYFLLGKEQVLDTVRQLMRYRMTDSQYENSLTFLHQCNHILVRYISCDLLDGVAVGVCNYLFMLITKMPYAVLISVVVAIANLVPTFGPIIGGAAGALILLLVNPKYVLWFLIFTVILQTIDGYILKPHLYGDTLGVSPLWILVCIILGGRIFGITGVVLAIPFAAISDYVFYEQVWKKVEAKDRNYSGEEKTANGTSWESRGAKTKNRNKKQ